MKARHTRHLPDALRARLLFLTMIAAASTPSAPCDFPWVHVPDVMTKQPEASAHGGADAVHGLEWAFVPTIYIAPGGARTVSRNLGQGD